MTKAIFTLFLILLTVLCAEAQDTICVSDSAASIGGHISSQDTTDSILPFPSALPERLTIRQMAHREMSYAPLPLAITGFAFWGQRNQFRTARNQLEPNFSHHFDDYIQYAPLAATFILKVAGVQGRSNWGRFLVSGSFSYIIMAGLCNGMKYTIREQRPDGSSRNSFPSGHTATAFAAATILHKEYGLTRSPWYSVGGYAIATTTGVMRTMNNRHWVSDVLVGAAIGIVSVDLGYFFGDLIFKEKGLKRRYREDICNLYKHPSFFNISMGVGFTNHISTPMGKFKAGVSSQASAEAAYFINPYVGFGGRLRVINTPVTANLTNLYASDTHKTIMTGVSTIDQQSSFSATLGVYGSYPISHRFAVGGKLLMGRTRIGSMDFSPSANENETADKLSSGSGASFIGSLGASATYAYRHGFAWRIGIDYDISRPTFTMDYTPAFTESPRSETFHTYLHHFSIDASMNIMF